MKILHVVNISFVIPYFLGNQLNWFSEKGYEEYVICSPSGDLEKMSEKYHFNYHIIDIIRRISLWRDIKAIYSTIKYIKNIQPDVVIGHTPKGGLVAITAAWMMRIPKRIYFRHGLVYETSKGFKRFLLISVDRIVSVLATKIVCVSPSLAAKSLKDSLNPEWKQVVLAKGSCNGIDLNRFSKNSVDSNIINELRRKFGVKSDSFVIGFAGRLVRDKGVIDLVTAYKQLKREYNNIKLLLVGMYEERDALPNDVVKVIEEDDDIIKAGRVDYSEMELYYALMDVFVLPSYREGFGMSVIEASAMEIPVISTRVTGCVDSVIDKKTGILVNNSVDEIKEAIMTLYCDSLARERLGRDGRDYVETCFDQTMVWKDIEKLYTE